MSSLVQSDASIRGSFGKRLKELRLGRQLTQRGLAEASGVHNANISQYETGTHSVGLQKLLRLCEGLGLTPEERSYLVFGPSEPSI